MFARVVVVVSVSRPCVQVLVSGGSVAVEAWASKYLAERINAKYEGAVNQRR